MDVRQLRYFCRILELRSITKAAESLHVSQPSLGMHVRNLEHELQTQLVTRHSRGIEPTEAGQMLFDRARRILAEIDETRRLLRDHAGSPRGSVRLGITPCVDAKLVASVIESCAIEIPDVNVEIVEDMNPSIMEWAQSGEIDLGIVHYLDDAPANLAHDALGDDTAVLVVSTDYATALGDTIPFAEAVRHPLAMPPLPHRLRELVEATARNYGLEVNVRFEMRSIPVITELVERHISCSILPIGAIAGKLADGKVRALKITDPTVTASMSLIYAARRPLSKASSFVRALVTEAAGKSVAPELLTPAPMLVASA
jgi:LysR family transcriptional regulator, nitrogen assimilation regulatory protein